VLPVQVDVRPLCLPASDVEVSPPIGVRRKSVAGIFVQTIVELVRGQSDYHSGNEDDRPVGFDNREELAGQHVEVGWLGGVEKNSNERSCVEGRAGRSREVVILALHAAAVLLIGIRHAQCSHMSC
jgi:hypothetical protein